MRQSPPIPRQRTEDAALARLRSDHSDWEIFRTRARVYALRRDSRPSLQAVSACTAAGLLADLEHIEEAAT